MQRMIKIQAVPTAISRLDKPTDNSSYWHDKTLIAEKNYKLHGDQSTNNPHISRKGSFVKELTKQTTNRSVRGDPNPEHIMAGKTMAELMQPHDITISDFAKTQRDNTPKNLILSVRFLSPEQ